MQKQTGGHCSRHAVGMDVPNPGIFEVDRIHQVVQGNVRIATGQAGEQRRQQAGKRA